MHHRKSEPKKWPYAVFHRTVSGLLIGLVAASAAWAEEAIRIGSRRELFVDRYLVERMDGAQLRLGRPTPREVAMVLDRPWEGNACAYVTVFQDGGRYRMYYRGAQTQLVDGKTTRAHREVVCYAESRDGVRWSKPELNLVEFEGPTKNNILWDGPGSHDFAPFKDTNPDCPDEARYKAVGRGTRETNTHKMLFAFQSADGVHWSLMSNEPIITKGAFDSQNLAFWDEVRGEYRAYLRDFREGRRDIRTATSKDFLHWTDPVFLEYPGAPEEQLYTNQIKPYYRAPHIFIGFPTRYLDRGWSDSMRALPDAENRQLRASANRRYGTALTESLLMTSRDGQTFHRWPEAFLRPGPERNDSWAYGDQYVAWHVVETRSAMAGAPGELSLYATEGYWTGQSVQLRRYTLRLDGFVSVWGPVAGGELVTRPLVFEGRKLQINFSTSAAGSVRVEIQDAEGTPMDGFALADCPDVFGDALDRVVSWKDGPDVSHLAGKPVRLRFLLKDADLFSFRFVN